MNIISMMKKHCKGSNSFLAASFAALTIILIWFPFGFSLGGLVEEWDFTYYVTIMPAFWNSFPGHMLSETFSARPFQITPFWLAHWISPNSFLGFHVLLMAACFLRIFAGIMIGKFLFRGGFFAVLLGLLAFTFPAETQQIALRTLNISCSLALALCGNAAVLAMIDSERPARRWCLLALSIATFVCAALIYEPSLALYAIAPLLIFARDGLSGSLRVAKARRAELLVWLFGPVTNAAYLFYAIHILKSGYEVGTATQGIVGGIRTNLHYLTGSLAFRMFLDAWRSTFLIAGRIVAWPYFALIAAILLTGFWALRRRDRISQDWISQDWRFVLRLLVSGGAIAVLAYAPFMVSRHHMVITQRVMMAPQFGAALVFVAVLFALLGRFRPPLVILSAALVFMGFVAQIYQMDSYSRRYTGVTRPYLSTVADEVDLHKKIHLVIDRTGYGGALTGIYTSVLSLGLPVRLHQFDQQFVLCIDQPQTMYILAAQCSRDGDVWKIKPPDSAPYTAPAAQVDTIKLGPDIDANAHAHRGVWHDLGSFTPAQSLFRQPSDRQDRFRCEPDSEWGYSEYCRTSGWSGGVPTRRGLRQINFLFAVSPEARFLFDLKPAASPYTLRITTLFPPDPALLKAIRIRVNGHPVSFDLRAPDLIEAAVDPQDLVDGANDLTLENAVPAGQPTGLQVTRVNLLPTSARQP